jgi:hypothetical protein
MAAQTSRPTSGRDKEPRVGIFWLVNGKLLIDSTPLGRAQPYGDHLTHSRGHDRVWGKFQQRGTAPRAMEYDEPPRGRVVYHTKTGRFALLADRCIFRDKAVVRKIMSDLNLRSENTYQGTDAHYRCFARLHGSAEDLF